MALWRFLLGCAILGLLDSCLSAAFWPGQPIPGEGVVSGVDVAAIETWRLMTLLFASGDEVKAKKAES